MFKMGGYDLLETFTIGVSGISFFNSYLKLEFYSTFKWWEFEKAYKKKFVPGRSPEQGLDVREIKFEEVIRVTTSSLTGGRLGPEDFTLQIFLTAEKLPNSAKFSTST
jgi:hypothetical protein